MYKNKYAIYTAIVGGYDKINQPKVVDNRFDYILFSNDLEDVRVGVWQVKKIFYDNEIQTKIARYVKTHPEELLPEYEFTIWMDSNLIINTNYIYNRSLQLYKNAVVIATMNHLDRNCIYEEAFFLMDNFIEYESIILDWCHYLHRQCYPKKSGLFETNVMYRINKNGNVRNCNALWWSLIEKYSKRDQLSFNYVLWKLEIVCEYILPINQNTRNSLHFDKVEHSNASNRGVRYEKKVPWLMRYYLKKPNSKEEIKRLYSYLSFLPFPKLWALFFGQYYRVKYLLQKFFNKL